MAWAKCPTHGPIQDAAAIEYGGQVIKLVCRCNLTCEAFEPPSGFVEHDELLALSASGMQPRDTYRAPEVVEVVETDSVELVSKGGGVYLLPSGKKVRGRAKAEEELAKELG